MRQKLLPAAAGAEMYAAERPSGATRMLGSAPPPSSLTGTVQAGVVPAAVATVALTLIAASGAASRAQTDSRRTDVRIRRSWVRTRGLHTTRPHRSGTVANFLYDEAAAPLLGDRRSSEPCLSR